MRDTHVCKLCMGTKISTSCQQVTTVHNRIKLCRMRWEQKETSYGLWNQKHQAKVKESKLYHHLKKFHEVRASLHAWCNSISKIHFWLMDISGIWEYMSPLLRLILYEFMFMKRDCVDLPQKNTIRLTLRTSSLTWQTILLIRNIKKAVVNSYLSQ